MTPLNLEVGMSSSTAHTFAPKFGDFSFAGGGTSSGLLASSGSGWPWYAWVAAGLLILAVLWYINRR
jgi:hypothetical protein